MRLLFSSFLCLLGLQAAYGQALSVKRDAAQPPEIPAHLRRSPDALRSYLQKQELIRSTSQMPETAAPGIAAPTAGNLDTTFAGGLTDGTATVNSVAVQPDGKILIGGFFSSVNGVQRRGLERLNADGTLDPTFNPGGVGANGTVYVIIPLADGKILVSGNFTFYNDTARGRIARLNADGTLDDSFNVVFGFNNSVHDTIIQPDGRILVSGNFTFFETTSRNRVARLNTDGSLDQTFNPNVNAFTEEMILQPDGKIVIGGTFTNVGGVQRGGVARLNADGTVDLSFNPGSGVQLNGAPGAVYGMELQADGKILIGGDFDFYNGAPRLDIARLNTDGSLDTGFGSIYNEGSAEFFAIQPDGKILVAGDLGFASNRFAVLRLNADGTQDDGFIPTPVDNIGYVVGLQPDGKILAGGWFTGAVKRLNANGAPDATFNVSARIEATVRSIEVQPDGKILVGGDFKFANGVARRNIARFNANGTLDETFNPGSGPNLNVYSIAVQSDGKILIGGNFTHFAGEPRQLVARLNANGSLDESFVFTDAVSFVYDIEVQPDGRILLGGYFFNTAFVFGGIVRLLPNGSYDPQVFNVQGANSFVTEIELLSNGRIMIGGAFTDHSGFSRNRIARLNADLTLDTSFNPGAGANNTVWDIDALANGQFYVAGAFSSFNNNGNHQDIVRLNANGSIDPAFVTGNGFNGVAYSIVPQADGKVLVGGNFFGYQNTTINYLAQLNPDGSLDPSVAGFPVSDGFLFVWKLAAQPDGRVLVGGRFNSYGGQTRHSLMRLNTVTRAARFDYDGDGKADISVFRPSDRVWYLSRSNAGFAAVQFGFATDRLTPADYDGDGKTDVSVFRDGTWYWIRSSDAGVGIVQFGSAGDVPQPGDWDGDGKDDHAVFRQGVWYILRSSDLQVAIFQFGLAGDKPVSADYDGDGKTDAAVFRDGAWWILRSTDGGASSPQFGLSTDRLVPADYDGDGKTDLAVYRDGTWYIARSTDGGVTITQFGIATDVPAPADYDGDGRADTAVFRDGTWYVQKTSDGQYIIAQFGLADDIATPASFIQ